MATDLVPAIGMHFFWDGIPTADKPREWFDIIGNSDWAHVTCTDRLIVERITSDHVWVVVPNLSNTKLRVPRKHFSREYFRDAA